MRQKSIYSNEQEKLVKKLKQAREEANFTQEQAAKKLNHTQSYLSKVESGQITLDIIALKRFAKIYKRDLSFFID